MSLKNFLKDQGLITDDNGSGQKRGGPENPFRAPTVPTPPSIATSKNSGFSMPSPAFTPAAVQQKTDEKSLAILQQALEQSNVGGYKEFFAQFNALSEDIPSVAQRIKVVAKTIAASNSISKDQVVVQVVKAINDRLRILDGEKSKFESESENARRAESSSLENQLNGIKSNIANRRQELERLQTEIQNLESQQKSAEGQASQIDKGYQAGREVFVGTANELKRILEEQQKLLQAP